MALGAGAGLLRSRAPRADPRLFLPDSWPGPVRAPGRGAAAGRGREDRRGRRPRRGLGGAAPALLPPSSRPPQAPRARAALSFSDSCRGAQRAALHPTPSVPGSRRPPSPRHDHAANSAPGPGTVGLPPRGGQGLRAASRHFPGKSSLGRVGSGAIPGWGAA